MTGIINMVLHYLLNALIIWMIFSLLSFGGFRWEPYVNAPWAVITAFWLVVILYRMNARESQVISVGSREEYEKEQKEN